MRQRRATCARKRNDENTLYLFRLIYSITLLSDENTLFLIRLMCMLLYFLGLWTEDKQHRQPVSNVCDQVVLLFPQQSKSGAYLDSFLDSLGDVESAEGLVMHF